jgi:Anti-sigma-K factor rskA
VIVEHEDAAAFALAALAPRETRAFAAHLETCTVCAQELPSLQDAAAALAFACPSARPPALRLPERRGLLLRVDFRRRVVPLLAAAAACAALGLGVWAAVSTSTPRRPVALLVRPDAARFTLALTDLPAAPRGYEYVAWVIERGRPLRAGAFAGGRETVLPLEVPVRRGARVAVTLESRGATSPSGDFLVDVGTA